MFIGLGGTGVDIIRMLKHDLLAKGGNIPSHVQFLGIDTADQQLLPGIDILGNDEFISAQIREPEKYVNRKIHDPVQRWWPGLPKTRKAMHEGAGQVRAVGRLALHKNLPMVKNAIQEKIDKVVQVDVNARRRINLVSGANPAQIYIICSLCGGTGSGMFLDVSLLCREFMARRDNRINGIFVLPEIFARRLATQNIYANTYAALLELDHLMSVSDGLPETVEFSRDFSLEVDNPPFDWIYLVDKQSEKSGFINSLETLKSFVAEELQLMLLSEIGDQESRLTANLGNQLPPERGKRLNYGSFGHCFINGVQKKSPAFPLQMAASLARRLRHLPEDSEIEVASKLEKYEALALFNEREAYQLARMMLQKQANEIISFAVSRKRHSSKSIAGLLADKWGEDVAGSLEQKSDEWLAELKNQLKEDSARLLREEGGVVLCQQLFEELSRRVKIMMAGIYEGTGDAPFSPNGNHHSHPDLNGHGQAAVVEEEPTGTLRAKLWSLFSGNAATKANVPDDSGEILWREEAEEWLHRQFNGDFSRQLRRVLSQAYRHLLGCARQAKDMERAWEKTIKWLDEECRRIESEAYFQAEPSGFHLEIPAVGYASLEFRKFSEKYDYSLDWREESKEKLGGRLIQLANEAAKNNADMPANGHLGDLEATFLNLKKNTTQLKDFYMRADMAAVPMIEYSEGSMELGEQNLPRSVFIGYPGTFETDLKKELDIKSLASIDKSAPEIVSLRAFSQLVFTQKVFGLPGFAIAAAHPQWMERYWLESSLAKSHVWINPHQLEDLFPGVNNNRKAWALVGKAQAYGLLPWDYREPVQAEDFPFGLDNLLQGKNGTKVLFQIYLHLLCDVRTVHDQHLRFLVRACEKDERQGLSAEVWDKVCKKIEQEGLRDEQRREEIVGHYLSELKKACKDKGIPVPVRRFYETMPVAFEKQIPAWD